MPADPDCGWCAYDSGYRRPDADSGPCVNHYDEIEDRIYSHKNDPIEIIRRVRLFDKNPDHPDAMDPQDLATHKRRQCVPLLRDRGMSQAEIANVLKVHQTTIARDLKHVHQGDVEGVSKISELDLAAEILREARRAAPRLRRQGEYKKAYQVKADLVNRLNDLRLISTAPDRVVLSTRELDSFVCLVINTIREEWENVDDVDELVAEINRRAEASSTASGG